MIGQRCTEWCRTQLSAEFAAGNSNKPLPTNLKGFTLIELLVVIGVIGILAGLLLPTLAKARDQGRSVHCKSNLKQMGVAMAMYVADNEYYPPGRFPSVTQWDLCLGVYTGEKSNALTNEMRSAVFCCPSVKINNQGVRLNYSANPNICKEITSATGQVRADRIRRPVEVISVGDAIQYSADGTSHAILWGVEASNHSAIYWNDGDPAKADCAIPVGRDSDGIIDVNDPGGSNFRYRHGESANLLFLDAHVSRVLKGRIRDGHLYTNY